MSGYPNDQGNPAGAIPVYGSGGGVPATNGDVVYPTWPGTNTYSAGVLSHTDVTNPTTSAVYRNTFTYNGDGTLASWTGWVKQ